MQIFFISDIRVVLVLVLAGVLFSLLGWRELRRHRRARRLRTALALLLFGVACLVLPIWSLTAHLLAFYSANRTAILLWLLTGAVALIVGLGGVWMVRDLRQRRAWQRAVRVMASGSATGRSTGSLPPAPGRAVPVQQYLQNLSPAELETFSARLFQQLGYRAEMRGGSGDHGVDVQLTNSFGGLEVVQCKQYRSPVGEPEMRAFYGTLVHSQAVKGYFVAPGGFTRQARRWASGKPIVLADAAVLAHLINQAGRA